MIHQVILISLNRIRRTLHTGTASPSNCCVWIVFILLNSDTNDWSDCVLLPGVTLGFGFNAEKEWRLFKNGTGGNSIWFLLHGELWSIQHIDVQHRQNKIDDYSSLWLFPNAACRTLEDVGTPTGLWILSSRDWIFLRNSNKAPFPTRILTSRPKSPEMLMLKQKEPTDNGLFVSEVQERLWSLRKERGPELCQEQKLLNGILSRG